MACELLASGRHTLVVPPWGRLVKGGSTVASHTLLPLPYRTAQNNQSRQRKQMVLGLEGRMMQSHANSAAAPAAWSCNATAAAVVQGGGCPAAAGGTVP